MKALRQNSVIFEKDFPKWRREPITHTGQFFLKSDILTIGFMEVETRDYKYYAISNLGKKKEYQAIITGPGGIDINAFTINCEDLDIDCEWCIAAIYEGVGNYSNFYSDIFYIYNELPEPSVFVSAFNRHNYDGIYTDFYRFGARFPLKYFKWKDVFGSKTVFSSKQGIEIVLNSDTYNIYTAVFGRITRKQAILLKYLLSSHQLTIDGKMMCIAQGSSAELIEDDSSDLCYIKISLTEYALDFGNEMSGTNPFDKITTLSPIGWILETGFWQDANKWIDDDYWID